MKSTKIKFTYITLFPQLIESYFSEGLFARALRDGIFEPEFVQLREYSQNKYKSVDGKSYGGGDGMVLSVGPLVQAIEDVRSRDPQARVVCLTPQGKPFKQQHAIALAEHEHLVFVCGRYAGFDQRIEFFCDESFSIGDYVLSGGELPALVMTESIMRHRPGFLGNQVSALKDSFASAENASGALALRLESPQFSEPTDFRGFSVPPVLLSGHHQKIQDWKTATSLILTFMRRPDLVTPESMSKEERQKTLEFLKHDKDQIETWLGALMQKYQFSSVDLERLQRILETL